jgi:hypothetical protein
MNGSNTITTSSTWQYYPDQMISGTYITPATPQPVTPAEANIIYDSPSGIHGDIIIQKSAKGIHPKLYFSYVKSKFNKLEREKLVKRIGKLRSMVISADEMDQQALHERLALMLTVAVRESEACVCGYEKFIHKDHLNKFIGSVRGRTVLFGKLESFPRLIPDGIKNKIKMCKLKNIFDEYWIVYTDYTGEKEKIKTNKEKIREKDPIVFGTFSFQEDVLYVIGDWIDEYCDITIDKVVEKLRKDDPEYNLGSIPELSEKNLKKLVEEVKIRHLRLKGTNPSNFQDNMVKEDEDKSVRRKAFGFWSRLNKKIRGT